MDLGLEVVASVREQLAVDDEWCVDHNRGFTWWGQDLAQAVWAESSLDDDGIDVWRLHARIDLVLDLDGEPRFGLLAALNALSGLSSIARDPSDPGRLQLITSVYVHEDNAEWTQPLFALAAALQTAEGHAIAAHLADVLGGRRASSVHPTSGEREYPDEVLAAVDALPLSDGGSRFRGGEMEGAAAFLLDIGAADLAESSAGQLVAQLPFDDEVWILHAETDVRHARYGAGLMLTLRPGFVLPKDRAAELASHLMTLELASLTRAHLLGSWCLSPGERPALTFHAFFPNVSYRAGLLRNLLLSMSLRARFAAPELAREQHLSEYTTAAGSHPEPESRPPPAPARVEKVFLNMGADPHVTVEGEQAENFLRQFITEEDRDTATVSHRTMETRLLRDSDWAPLDGQVCRVTRLTALGPAKGLPYASVELESPLLGEPTTGFVTHKLDFEHLSEAFSRRESEPNTEVLIIWTKRFLKRHAKLVAWCMPRMWVMLCRENAYELMTDPTYEPELHGLERHLVEKPIAEWKPDVME